MRRAAVRGVLRLQPGVAWALVETGLNYISAPKELSRKKQTRQTRGDREPMERGARGCNFFEGLCELDRAMRLARSFSLRYRDTHPQRLCVAIHIPREHAD